MSSEKEGGGLDIFKVVLVVCGLACVAFGVLLYIEYGSLAKVKQGYRRGEGLIAEIRATSEAIALLKKKEQSSAHLPRAHDYIERFIMDGTGLGPSDFGFKDGERAQRTKKQGWKDSTITVTFGAGRRGKDQKAISRKNLFVVLYNLESQSPQYKIGKLHMIAQEVGNRNKEAPTTLSDNWYIRNLEVIQRVPAKVIMSKGRKKSSRSGRK